MDIRRCGIGLLRTPCKSTRSWMLTHVPVSWILSILFIGLLLCLDGGYGNILIRPKHIIEISGRSVTFNCSSDITNNHLEWSVSAARQPSTDTAYEGSLKDAYKNKMNVTDIVNGTARNSTLTINNITMNDAGTIFCRDDGPFGKVSSAKLSVTSEVVCHAACVDDHLLVVCSICYWSEDNLILVLQHGSDFIKANSISESFNDSKNCVEHQSLWATEAHCQTLNTQTLSVILAEISTNSSKSFPILRVLGSVEIGLQSIISIFQTTNDTSTKTCRPTTDSMDNNSILITIAVIGLLLIFIGTILTVVTIYFRIKSKPRHMRSNRNVHESIPEVEMFDLGKSSNKSGI